MTLQERYIKALVAYGYVISAEQPRLRSPKTYSRKYVRMHKDMGQAEIVYWVGRAGAVRQGHTVTGSHAMNEAWKAALIKGQLRGGGMHFRID